MVSEFSDALLLKIFRYLQVGDLNRCSRVCKQWRRVSDDGYLWMNTDLRRYRRRLDENTLVKLVKTLFRSSLRKLDLSSFSLTPRIFSELSTHCPNLQVLVLENVTFLGYETRGQKKTAQFPKNLKLLNLRYSNGDPEAYESILASLTGVECLIASNTMFDSTSSSKIFKQLGAVRLLDFTHCKNLKDSALSKISKHCPNLEALSLRHCNNVSGNHLHQLVKSCQKLRALSITSTKLDDENWLKCDWKGNRLEELEVCWNTNLTSKGLRSTLPLMSNLSYLKICSNHNGCAMDGDVLTTMSRNFYPRLKTLDLGYCREVENRHILEFIHAVPSLKQVRLNCCRMLTADILDHMPANKMLVVASFRERPCNNYVNIRNLAASGGNTYNLTPAQEYLKTESFKKYSTENELKRLRL